MANIIRIGEAGGSDTGEILNINTGKINLLNGNIDTSETDYSYTDKFDCPQGDIYMDFGATYNTDAGVVLYSDTGAYVDYWQAKSRYRWINEMPGYYQSGYKMRLSFPNTAKGAVLFVDDTGKIVYTDFDIHHIGG